MENRAEQLKKAIAVGRREEILNLLGQGVLKEIPQEIRYGYILGMVRLRDMKITDALFQKGGEKLLPEMMQLNFNDVRDRGFVCRMLSAYGKLLPWDDEEACRELFSVACLAGHTGTIGKLMKQQKYESEYAQLSRSSDVVFKYLLCMKPSKISADGRVQILYGAALSENPEARLEELEGAGYDWKEKNTDGKTAADLLQERMKTMRYAKNRSGELAKKRDEQMIRLLRREKNAASEKGLGRLPLKHICIVAAACVLVGCIAAAAGNPSSDSSDTETTTTEEITTDTETITADTDTSDEDTTTAETDTSDENTTTNDTEETTTDTDAITTDAEATEEDSADSASADSDEVSYATDTSLTVADGDTVNIDYTGYMDGEAFDGGSTNGSGADLTIGSGTYIDDFEEQLIGHNVGETVTVEVTFPDDYGAADLAGKDAEFEVTINGIYQD